MRAAIALFILCLAVAGLSAQDTAPAAANSNVKDPVYICPMDPNMRSNTPGKCPKCGMATGCRNTRLRGVPSSCVGHAQPDQGWKKGAHRLRDFRSMEETLPVSKFQVIHEKLFHAFFISDDLQFFVHDHPIWDDGLKAFFYDIVFPKPGTYRVLGDFYPDGATPQLIANTLIVPGKAAPKVSLTTGLFTRRRRRTFRSIS